MGESRGARREAVDRGRRAPRGRAGRSSKAARRSTGEAGAERGRVVLKSEARARARARAGPRCGYHVTVRSNAYKLFGFLVLRSLLFAVRRLDRFGLPFAGRVLILASGLRRYRLLGLLLWKTMRWSYRRFAA